MTTSPCSGPATSTSNRCPSAVRTSCCVRSIRRDPNRATTPQRKRTRRLAALSAGAHPVEVAAQLLELVAQARRLLEAEVVGRGPHLLLRRDDRGVPRRRG